MKMNSMEKLNWEFAVDSAQTLDRFIELGERRGLPASWAYRRYAARLDQRERLHRDMERIRKSLSPDRVVVQKPRQHSKTYGLGDPYDDQKGGAS
tara:strand:- start:4124 stop:4408 length:285 start_codon:yes stop_codon:yes gene_type:complete